MGLCGLLCPDPPPPPITEPEPGSVALRLSRSEHGFCGSRSPSCPASPWLLYLGYFTLAGLSRLHNEHRWLREQRRESKRAREGVGAVVHALVSVSSRRFLEYKWNVLIHLNQGHMFKPTVKCSELNEALCCIYHPPQDIKLGTNSALQETLCNLQSPLFYKKKGL